MYYRLALALLVLTLLPVKIYGQAAHVTNVTEAEPVPLVKVQEDIIVLLNAKIKLIEDELVKMKEGKK